MEMSNTTPTPGVGTDNLAHNSGVCMFRFKKIVEIDVISGFFIENKGPIKKKWGKQGGGGVRLG